MIDPVRPRREFRLPERLSEPTGMVSITFGQIFPNACPRPRGYSGEPIIIPRGVDGSIGRREPVGGKHPRRTQEFDLPSPPGHRKCQTGSAIPSITVHGRPSLNPCRYRNSVLPLSPCASSPRTAAGVQEPLCTKGTVERWGRHRDDFPTRKNVADP